MGADGLMQHYYTDVPRLGNVALSRHAQYNAAAQGVPEEMIKRCLTHGADRPDGDATWRDHGALRLVIIRPTPWRGAWLVKTLYLVAAQEKARR